MLVLSYRFFAVVVAVAVVVAKAPWMQRKTIHRSEEFEFIKIIYFSFCSVSFVLFGRIYYITPDNKSLSETLLLAALIVTGECRAKTIADNSNQKM